MQNSSSGACHQLPPKCKIVQVVRVEVRSCLSVISTHNTINNKHNPQPSAKTVTLNNYLHLTSFQSLSIIIYIWLLSSHSQELSTLNFFPVTLNNYLHLTSFQSLSGIYIWFLYTWDTLPDGFPETCSAQNQTDICPNHNYVSKFTVHIMTHNDNMFSYLFRFPRHSTR